MKKLLLLTTLITFVLGVSAQTTIFEDDFEAYTPGTGLVEQSDDWETWSGGSGGSEDAIVSDDYAMSGSNSVLVTDANDMIYPLGQKTSGVYNIKFAYYLEDGYGGYYNFQHTFGSEWAFAVFFSDDGTGYLEVGGEEYELTYPQDEWFQIKNQINLDEDEATLLINGEEIHTWQYALLEAEDNTVDNPMLDVVNFYAAAEEPATPKYYYDDFAYIEVESGLNPPSVAIDTEELMVYETGSGVDSEVITIENEGEQALNFEVYPVYPMDDEKRSIASNETTSSSRKSLKNAETNMAASETEVSFNPNQRDGTLTHVVSDLNSGIGYASEVDVRAAAKFRPMDVEPYIGMTISEVIVYHAYAPMNGEGTLKIWERGSFTVSGPGTLVYEKEYSAPDAGQFTVSVDEDIYIDGKDLWVGYAITDPGDGVFPIGMDAGPQEPGVNYTSTGPGWSEMTGDDYGNIGVIVELVGDGIPTWMSVTPESGTIEAGGSEEVLVDFNTSGLDNGVYEAQIHVAANDPENNYTPIDVTLDISTAIIDGNEEKIGVMTFPNPASENINIKANDVITSVKLINQIGQVVYENNGGTESHAINVSNLEKGVYMVQVKTENSNITTQKVIVE